jgi:diguanylate cyclase (GGDEF)-like protein
MRQVSTRFLTISYIAALSIIALLSITSHITLDHVLQTHEGSAAVVNVSGRQRMLSQRIASLAAQYALGDPSAQAGLIAATDEFADNHRQLVEGNSSRHLPPADSAELKAIYFTGDYPLDRAVRDYVATARLISSQSPSDPGLKGEMTQLFAAAREPLLTQLNDVVKIHQVESEQQLSRLQLLQKMVLIVVLATLCVEAMVIFQPMVRRIAKYHAELMRLATTDPLTGLLNRRSFFDRGIAELRKARRGGQQACFLMLDVDHFKKINDTYGHKTGDIVLKALAEKLLGALRPGDLAGRLGGEEFAVLLPDTTLVSAEVAAQRLCDHIAQMEVSSESEIIKFTVSIGAADFEKDALTLQPAMDRADAALYRAKAEGRNRVILAKPAPEPARTVIGELAQSGA